MLRFVMNYGVNSTKEKEISETFTFTFLTLNTEMGVLRV